MMSRPRSSLARMTQAPWSLNLSSTRFSSKLPTLPARNVLGGSESTLGNMKRTVPSVSPAAEAVNAVQAMANHEPKIALRKKRRSLPLAADLAGGLAGGAGLAGAGGEAVTAGDVAITGGGPPRIAPLNGVLPPRG